MYPLFPDIPATVGKNTNKQDFKAQFKRFSKSGFADTIHIPSKKSCIDQSFGTYEIQSKIYIYRFCQNTNVMLKNEKNNRYKVIIQNLGFCRHNSDIAQHPSACLGGWDGMFRDIRNTC